MRTETEHLQSLLKTTYEKGAWHGPSVKEVLVNIDESSAGLRLPNSHSIIELVDHMTAWRRFVIHKLRGDSEYVVSDSMNFPAPTGWLTALQNLEESQAQLLAEIGNFPNERLDEFIPHAAYKCTFSALLHGIIHHDLYHIGQISLIKKSLPS